MAEFRHLTDEKLEHVTNRLWEVESSLRCKVAVHCPPPGLLIKR